jgi:hypothetical protein
LLKDANRLTEEEPMLARALAAFEQSLGFDHPNSVNVRKNLARLREKMRN